MPREAGQFKKGQSGNPSGRPKGVAEVQELARKHTPAAIETLLTICKNEDAPPPARVSAAVALLDRAWGKPVQPTEITGKDGGPIATAALPADPVEAARAYQRLVSGV